MKRLLTPTVAVMLLALAVVFAVAGGVATAADDAAVAAGDEATAANDAATAAGDDMLRLDLRTAVELAHASNVDLLLAEHDVESARLGLEQVQAMSLIEPSPTLLLQSETGLRLAERSLSLAKQELAFEVEEAYYNVLRLQNLLNVLDDAHQMSRRQLEIAESRRRSGVATDIDVLRARTSLMQTEADKAQAEDNLDLVLVRFRQTVGLDPDTTFVLDDTVVTHDPVDVTLQEALDEALAHRLELAQVRLGIEVAERELELATNDYTPELTRVQAMLDLEQARLRLRQAEDGIVLDVHNAYNELQDAHRRLKVADQRLAEMEENWRVVQALFDARMATDVEILQGQTGLAEARTAAVNAVFDYNVARAAFFQAIARELDHR